MLLILQAHKIFTVKFFEFKNVHEVKDQTFKFYKERLNGNVLVAKFLWKLQTS